MLLVWVILLGASSAVIKHDHFVIDLFEGLLVGVWQSLANVLVHSVVLFISVFFLIHSYDYMLFGSMQNSDYMQINTGWFLYSSLFLSACVWCLASLVHVHRQILAVFHAPMFEDKKEQHL